MRFCSCKSKVPIPCSQECENRTESCHSTCNKFKAYTVFKQIESKRKAVKRQEVSDSIEYQKEFRIRYLKKSQRKTYKRK